MSKFAKWLTKWGIAISNAQWLTDDPTRSFLRLDRCISFQERQDIEDYLKGKAYISRKPGPRKKEVIATTDPMRAGVEFQGKQEG